MANRLKKLKKEVSTPSQACLTRETGESGRAYKSHQPFRERHPTPLAIFSGCHFEKVSTHSSFLKISFGQDVFEKQAPFSDETSTYTWRSLLDFFSETPKKLPIMTLEKRTGVHTSHQRIASTLRRTSPIRFDSGCKTRETTYHSKTQFRMNFYVSKTFRKRWPQAWQVAVDTCANIFWGFAVRVVVEISTYLPREVLSGATLKTPPRADTSNPHVKNRLIRKPLLRAFLGTRYQVYLRSTQIVGAIEILEGPKSALQLISP